MISYPIVFLHIPKTGGRTLEAVLKRGLSLDETYKINWGPLMDAFKKMPPEKRDRVKLLHGHIPFGYDKYFSGKATYVTFLRNPVQRIISEYFYLQERPKHFRGYVPGESLESYIESGINAVNNYQVRMLAGREDAPLECSLIEREELESAKRNLCECAAFGILERYDASMLLIGRRLGIKNIFYVKQNQRVSRMRGIVPAHLHKKILEKNALDCELYEFANMLFNKTISEYGVTAFRRNLFLFRNANRSFQASFSFYSGMKTAARLMVKRKTHASS